MDTRQAIQMQHANQSPIHKYRRNRKVPSCEPCRKSKVACNHSLPCSRCIKRRRVDECYYHPNPLTRVSNPHRAVGMKLYLPLSRCLPDKKRSTEPTEPTEPTGNYRYGDSKSFAISSTKQYCPEPKRATSHRRCFRRCQHFGKQPQE